MITVQNLNVSYAKETLALEDISFHFHSKVTVVVGMNGSGKSTLLNTIVGLNDYEGSILVDNLEVSSHKAEVRKKVGMVFQNPDDQLFMSTIYDDLAFGLINMDREPKEKVQEIAQKFNFTDLLKRSSHKLSGGQKRIAALMTVLIMEPEIILMDEPTSFLDSKSRRMVIEYIQGCPTQLIIATHDLDMAYEIADEIVLMNNSHLIASGDRSLLLNEELLEENGLEQPLMFQKI